MPSIKNDSRMLRSGSSAARMDLNPTGVEVAEELLGGCILITKFDSTRR